VENILQRDFVTHARIRVDRIDTSGSAAAAHRRSLAISDDSGTIDRGRQGWILEVR